MLLPEDPAIFITKYYLIAGGISLPTGEEAPTTWCTPDSLSDLLLYRGRLRYQGGVPEPNGIVTRGLSPAP